MAVQEPRPGIIFLERDGEIAIPGKDGDVATRRVGEVEGGGAEGEGADFLGEHPEVMAVEVDWVKKSGVVRRMEGGEKGGEGQTRFGFRLGL